MGSHPINLTLRFLLELAALACIGLWGWKQFDGPIHYLIAIGTPVIAAILWGTFAVPNDPSRSGKAPVPVPGILRLLIELIFFGLAVWALFAIGYIKLGWTFGILVLVHYLVSYDRIRWLISK